MSGNKQIPDKQVHAAAGAGPTLWQRLGADAVRLFLYQRLFIFLVALLVFANGISNGFNIDDVYYTTPENPVANKGLSAIPQLFTTRTLYDNSGNNFDYRPVAMLSFVLQHQLLGGHPYVSHGINVLIYAFVCVLIFTMLCRWLGSSRAWFAFFVTLLYAVHPLHTEVVDNIKCRDELLASIFGWLMLLSVWKWHASGKTRYLALGIVSLVAGLLSKQTIVIYVAVLPVSFYFFSDMPVRKIMLSFGALCLVYIVVAMGSRYLLPAEKRVFLFFENPMYVATLPLQVKCATISYILGWYAYLHVLPYPLVFYYGYSYVPLVYWGWPPVLAVICYLLLLFVIFKNIRKKNIIAFGGVFYLVCIVPFSNLLGPAPGLMAERYTFASSLGYCILIVAALYSIYKILPGQFLGSSKRVYFLITFSFILVAYAGMSIARNRQWESGWTLYSHDIVHLSSSVKANMFYGEQVMSKARYYREAYGQSEGADKQLYTDSVRQYEAEEPLPYLRVVAIAPDYVEALNNLGVIYIDRDSCDEALKYLLHARAVAPGNSDVTCNLGIAYARLGASNTSLTDSAIDVFKATIRIDPKLGRAYDALSLLYLNQKDTAAAINNLLLGIKNIPDRSSTYAQLAMICFYQKDTLQAIHYYEQGAEVPNPDAALLQTLVNYYHGKNDKEKENYYRKKASGK